MDPATAKIHGNAWPLVVNTSSPDSEESELVRSAFSIEFASTQKLEFQEILRTSEFPNSLGFSREFPLEFLGIQKKEIEIPEFNY